MLNASQMQSVPLLPQSYRERDGNRQADQGRNGHYPIDADGQDEEAHEYR